MKIHTIDQRTMEIKTQNANYLKFAYIHHVARMSLPKAFAEDLELSNSFSIIYRAATCNDGRICRGGDHILESLAGRAYNLALAATLLAAADLYDEALNSVRSLGELANVIAYLTLFPEEYSDWVKADKKARLKRYSPSAIRKGIESQSAFLPPMEQKVYSELCELATHVHSDTAPNAFSDDGRRHAGGFRQDAGAGKVAELLSYTLATTAIIISKMVERDDLFEEAIAAFTE